MPEEIELLLKTNPEQFWKDFLIGVMLGDASISTDNTSRTKKGSLIFQQSTRKHQNYLYHLFEICNFFKLLVAEAPKFSYSIPNDTVPTSHPRLRFQTMSTNELYGTYHHFYVNRIKTIPPNIRSLLEPVSIAYWYMDDGSLKEKGRSFGTCFNTLGNTIYEVMVLCDILRRKFNLLASPRQQKNMNRAKLKSMGLDPKTNFDPKTRKYQIIVSGLSFQKLHNLINPYLNQDIIDTKWMSPNKKSKGINKTTSVKEVKVGRYRRIIEKTPNGSGVIITEQILVDEIECEVEWARSITLEKNDAMDFHSAYVKSKPLSSDKTFNKWDLNF